MSSLIRFEGKNFLKFFFLSLFFFYTIDIVPKRILHCKIVTSCSQLRKCQSSNRTTIVRPKDKVTLNCSIKTGGKVQDMTWKDLEKTLSARNGLFVQQIDSSDGRQSCECYSIKYTSEWFPPFSYWNRWQLMPPENRTSNEEEKTGEG